MVHSSVVLSITSWTRWLWQLPCSKAALQAHVASFSDWAGRRELPLICGQEQERQGICSLPAFLAQLIVWTALRKRPPVYLGHPDPFMEHSLERKRGRDCAITWRTLRSSCTGTYVGLRSEQMVFSKRGMEDREARVHPKVIPLGDRHLWTGRSHTHGGDFQSHLPQNA